MGEFSNFTIRVCIIVTIEGAAIENVQRRHIPRICKEVLKDLKRSNYPWAEDAWTVWCQFPNVDDFVRSLAGVRGLVPDHSSGRQIREDDEDKPITYSMHKFKRQPPAPSLLGNTDLEDIMCEGANAITRMIEGLLTACDNGDIKKVRSILDSKCHVNAKDDAGLTAISVAAGLGHAEIVNLLVQRRADVNVLDAEGDSVITVAVGEGRTDVVKLLLANGANENIQVAGAWVDKPDDVVTLLDVAEKKGFTEIVALLCPKSDKKPKSRVAGKPRSLADELNFDNDSGSEELEA